MNLPNALKTQVRNQKVVLLLGAGASRDSVDEQGNAAPTTIELASSLTTRFLSESHKNADLMTVAELSISETDLQTVQGHIAGLFRGLRPNQGHKLMPTFNWFGLATTNYDQLIECAYESHDRPLQELKPLISDRDRIDDICRGPDALPLLKLHGCISRTNDLQSPFVITRDQYVLHRGLYR